MKLKSMRKQIITLILVILFVFPTTMAMLETDVLAATIVLPEASTSSDLQTAINNAVSGDILVISSNMDYTTTTPTVTVPAGKTITIQSSEGDNWVLSQPAATASFNVSGNLIFENITIDGENTGGYISVSGANSSLTMNSGAIVQNVSLAGGISVSQGTLNINDGAIIQNCHANEGGAGIYVGYGTLNMNGGIITNNESIVGGGIYSYSSTVNINNATISNNTSTQTYGGGIYGEYSYITVENSNINDNTANNTGGGICVIGGETTLRNATIRGNKTNVYHGGGVCFTESSFVIEECEITENITNENGGGIHIADSIGTISGSTFSKNESINSNGGGISLDLYAEVEITETNISDNKALNGRGGGIYTGHTKYSNLSTDENTSFSGNQASAAYIPPKDATELYPNIRFASTSIANHPLNNYDINYIGESYDANIIYTANGGYGVHIAPGVIPGEPDTILSLSDTEISREGYIFTGWNTAPDGSGINYQPGDSIILNDDIILYAQWIKDNSNLWPYVYILLIMIIIIFSICILIRCKKSKCQKKIIKK